MTSPRRAWQKSMSISGIEIRSGFRKRSNRRSYSQGVDLRDPERPRDDRAGGAAAAGADGDPFLPGVADEVGDDQEVRGETHLLDDADLVLQAVAVLLGRVPLRFGHLRDVLGETPLEAFAGEVAEVIGGWPPVRGRELRKVEAIRVEGDRAALGDRDGIRDGLDAPGLEPGEHFVRALDVELVVVEAHPPLVLERLAHADAEQDLVRKRVVAAEVVAVVGRHGRRPRLRREAEQVGHDRGLLRQAVVHDLDVEIALAEDLLVLEERLLRRPEVAPGQGPGHLALQAAGEADQALRVLPQELLVHPRPVVKARQIGLGDQPDQVAVPLLRRRQDRQVIRVALARLARGLFLPIRAVSRSDVGLDADDRPHAVLEGLVEEVERPEHVAVVGDRHRRHAELRDSLAQFGKPVRAVEKGVLAMEMEMNEVAGHRASIITPSEKPPPTRYLLRAELF